MDGMAQKAFDQVLDLGGRLLSQQITQNKKDRLP